MEESYQTIVCLACGTRNEVTITDFRPGAANRQEEHAACANCGSLILAKRCFAIEVRVLPTAK